MKLEKFTNLINSVNNIVITTHIHPDADGIGSEIALCLALRKLGKNVVCVNDQPLSERYKYLDPQGVIISYDDFIATKPVETIELFIVTDTNSLPRIGTNVQQLVLDSKNLLFIDHHPCPRELAAIHCIDTKKAATGELVGGLIEELGVEFDEAMALALYTAIIIDTSSFRYPTVTADTHRLISKLMDAGVKPPQAFNLINGTKSVMHMRLLGEVLKSCDTSKCSHVAWIKISENLSNQYNSCIEDTHGFINHLLILDGVKVACMFRQDGKKVKISLRAADNTVDVGIMAQALGGGGHNHSAATVIDGQIDEVIESTVEKIVLMLE